MRVARLDLTRYGKFTDGRLDFGPRMPGRSDLHVVYGPNEAGKTTAFSALLDLVFGFGKQSDYAFLHPYNTMRIGAALEIGGAAAREVVRIKRPQNSLLDPADQPLPEALLLGAFGGLDRDSYRSMFSLDDETLERGGEAIIASKGDLGQLLFAASAGIAELSQTLDGLRADAERFFRGRARAELTELKQKLDELKSERERLDTALPVYRKLVETAETSRVLYERERTERTRLVARAGEIDRLLQALPRFARITSLRQRLAALGDVPEPPPGWMGLLPDLERQEVELATKLAGCEAEIAQLRKERDDIVVDAAVLARADRIEDLTADGRARYTTAAKDLPERRRSLLELDANLAKLLRRLEREGEPAPDRLILSASVVGRFRQLIELRSGVDAKLESARRQHAEAFDALVDAQAMLEASGGTETGTGVELSSIRTLLGILRSDDHAGRRRHAERTRAALEDILGQQLLKLRPWAGTVERLAEAAIPRAADLARWKGEESEAAQASAHHGTEFERLTTERLRLKAELETVDQGTGLVSDAEAAAIRAEREQAWARHRRDLQSESADLFEAALRRDDLVLATRSGRDQELARLRQVAQALALADADLARAAALRDATASRQAQIHGEIAKALHALGWPAGSTLTASELETWLHRRAECLETAGKIRSEDRAIDDARADAQRARDRLAGALAGAGLAATSEASFTDLTALADSAIERDAERAGLRARLLDRRAAAAKRAADLARAAADDQAWNAAWSEVCASCWLGERGVAPTLATMREVLVALGDLGPLLETRAALALRISKMEEDQALFTRETGGLGRDLALTDNEGGPLDRATSLNARLRTAQTAQARRTDLSGRLDAVDARRRRLLEETAAHARRSGEMTTFFAVENLRDVEVKLQAAAQRDALSAEMRESEQELVTGLGAAALDEAMAMSAAVDRAALEAERSDFAMRIEALDERLRLLFVDQKKSADAIEAVGGDDAVARLAEARRTLLLDTEDRALRYLRLKIGIAAAEQALRAYREKHRSSMMSRASEAFQTISRGAYSGLAAQPGDKGDVLVALGQGGSKEASQLSKGTRFQLYLALRVAGYYEYCQSREPVPFVADDIMETFDDFRAEEAFRLFAQMAEVGQVIYLTHHRHLCDIARSVCPDVRIVDLSAAA